MARRHLAKRPQKTIHRIGKGAVEIEYDQFVVHGAIVAQPEPGWLISPRKSYNGHSQGEDESVTETVQTQEFLVAAPAARAQQGHAQSGGQRSKAGSHSAMSRVNHEGGDEPQAKEALIKVY